jgi:hypothetical protein
VLASALLITAILVVVCTKGLRGFNGVVIGAMVGLDIFFFAFVSDASMNPDRSLTPVLLLGGMVENLWLYWTATFIGTGIIAYIYRKKILDKIKNCLHGIRDRKIRNQKNSFRKDPFVLRVNSHLTITMNNKSITIPSQIGIDKPLWTDHALDKYGAPGMPMQGMLMLGMAPIYTTDNTRLIKLGSVVNRNYTLGEFFQIWGLDLDGKTVKATVDGKAVLDFKNIVLRDKENIVLYIKS